MDTTMQDTLFFFDRHKAIYPLYEQFQKKLLARFPITIGTFMPVCPF